MFTCNRILSSKYNTYLKIIESESEPQENIISGNPETSFSNETIQQKAFREIGVDDMYCCKRHLLSHIDLIQKI